ncbi:YraN family protein [Zafaria sp. Z1313]|uniref:YraN family protein n=1 Tax=Zafaria sp. Z1313 TaxID=3423202 RepID=UPI003D303384
MAHNQRLGARGEELVARYLADLGCTVLDRNWRCRAGELDLVVLDGTVVAGVEVKTRTGIGYGHPAEAVRGDKLRRLHVLVRQWCREHGMRSDAGRVDVAAVLVEPDGRHRIDYYRAVAP